MRQASFQNLMRRLSRSGPRVETELWVSEHRKLVTLFLKVLNLGPTPCQVQELRTVHRPPS